MEAARSRAVVVDTGAAGRGSAGTEEGEDTALGPVGPVPEEAEEPTRIYGYDAVLILHRSGLESGWHKRTGAA